MGSGAWVVVVGKPGGQSRRRTMGGKVSRIWGDGKVPVHSGGGFAGLRGEGDELPG